MSSLRRATMGSKEKGSSMRAVVVESPGGLSIRDIPEPEPGEYDAKVKVLAGSLCNGTDTKILHGQFGEPHPTILGHEAVGEVIAVGSKVRNYSIGDLVVRPHAKPPKKLGLTESFGAFVEFGLVTDSWALAEDKGQKIDPDRLPQQTRADSSWDPLTLVQSITFKETLSFLRNFGVKKADSLLIFGTGPVGISFSLWGPYLGCKYVIVVGRRDKACERALTFGGATHVINNQKENVPEAVWRITGSGATHVVEAIGNDSLLPDCLASLSQGGKVGIYGAPPKDQPRSPLREDARVVEVRVNEAMVDKEVLDLIQAGRIPAREFVSHELAFTECNKGFQLLKRREAFKVGFYLAS